MTTVVLIALYGKLQPPNAEPLAIEVLASALNRNFGNHIKIEMITLNRDNLFSISQELVSRTDIDIICLSVPQSTYHLSMDLLDYLGRAKKNYLIVLGHALPTHFPEVFLEKFPNILIVRGWGENALCRIVEEYSTGSPDWSSVVSLAYCHEKKIVYNLIDSPQTPSFPIRENIKKYFARMESSRGCHYNLCTFCTRPPMGNRYASTWIRFPPEGVLDHIRLMKSQGITEFTFVDEDFIGNDIIGAIKIAEGLKEIGGMKFSFAIRADNIYNSKEPNSEFLRRKKLFHLLKEAGLSLLFLGVESLSDSQLRRYGKGVSTSEYTPTLEFLLGLGIQSIEFGYILFDPFLTVNELQENVHFLGSRNYWRFVGQLFNQLRVQRDTAYFNLMRARGVKMSYNEEAMEYDYGYYFQDPTISKIAAICLHWKEDIDEVYALARNIQRTSFHQTVCGDFVEKIRELQFTTLRTMTDSLEIRRFHEIESNLIKTGQRLVQELKDGLESSVQLSLTEGALLKATELYLVSQPRQILN